MADKKDPTIKSNFRAADYPEGTHPPHPIEDTAHSPDRFVYKDNPDKPDPSSVAQIVEEK
jgi:hypothetical protein